MHGNQSQEHSEGNLSEDPERDLLQSTRTIHYSVITRDWEGRGVMSEIV